jgi:hypothetical protein
MRTYTGALDYHDFEHRFDYLKLNGVVAHSTFGGHRYLNQALYQSDEWRRIRRLVIIRDDGCDLAIPDRPIYGRVLVHHIEPITAKDILNRAPIVFDLDNLITVSHETHNALHYGDYSLVAKDVIIRRPNDTSPWLGD